MLGLTRDMTVTDTETMLRGFHVTEAMWQEDERKIIYRLYSVWF